MTAGKPVRAGLAAMLLVLAAGSALAGTQVLRRGTAAEPPSIDPTIAAGTLAAPIIADLFEGLVGKDAASRPVPGSAERWTVSEDGLLYVFHLRPGLRWSDGTPLTAEDFAWSFQRLLDPATASPLAGVFLLIDNAPAVLAGRLPPSALGVAATDPLTLEIRLAQPAPYLVEMLAGLQAVPVPRHVIEVHGREWTRPDRIVSNGPFVLVERVPQDWIRLRRNPHYHAAAGVRLDEVYWYPTQDLGTTLRRFRAGELDQVLNFPPEQLDWLRANMPDELRILPSAGVYFLVVNTSRKPFDDVRVRRALSLAIDREALTGRLLRTGVQPAESFASPDFNGYGGITLPEQAMSLPERQAEARRLLAAAGFGPGRPLEVDYVYDTQEENRQVAIALGSMLQQVGVRLKARNVDFGALNRTIRTGEFDLARWAYFPSFDDAYALLQLLTIDNPNNWPGYRNPAYDELLRRSNLEPEAAARQSLLREAEALMMADYPVLPVYRYTRRFLVAKRVGGWQDSSRGPTPSRWLWREPD